MTITRLTALPATITAGDTAGVTLALADYPAPTWNARWALAGTDVGSFASTDNADGTSHDFDLTTTQTTALPAGAYRWSLRVTDGTNVITVGTGSLTVLPDFGGISSDDEIAYCERMLLLCREARANILSGEVKMMMIDGRQTMFLTLAEVAKEEAHWITRKSALTGDGFGAAIRFGFRSVLT